MANTRLLGLLGILCIASVVFCGVESAQDSMLNVFVVPHSHDDVGWVKTIEDYYESEVRFILSTTVDTLMQDATRKFIQVEQGFFTLWWNDERTTDQQRQNLKFLVKNKQWEFVIGGWAMQDEACSTYSADIDQMTEGHQFLLDTFGVTPRLGWQIDPFGASSVTPTLFAMMGFDGHVIQRINWRTKKEMMQNKTMEFIWQGSPSLKQKTQIWTHLLDYNYCSPMGQGFNWEGNPFSNPWITNDNVHNRSVEFARLIKDKTNWYKSSNILIPWGCDFSFQDSLVQFMNMDKIIAYIQANPSIFGMNIKYALLSEFFDAVANDTTTTWPVFGAVDFFPYDDNDNSWWTGYYTSRNQLKGLVRHSEHLLRTVDTLFTVTQAKASMDSAASYKQIDVLRQAEAAVQHHDGVSGTEKDFVVDDYSARLFNGGNQAMNVTLTALGLLANSTNPTKFTNNTDLLLNLRVGRTVSFVAYNNLAWTRNAVIRLPLNRQDITVLDSNNNVVNFQINNASSDTINAKYALFVQVHLPALGYNTYFVKVTGTVPTNNIAVLTIPTNGVVVENTFLRVSFDSSSNLITQITNKKSSINIQAQQQTLAYTSYSSGGQNSGAYIFRPTGPASAINGNVAPSLTVQTGPLLSEVTQVFGDAINQGPSYFTQITRLYNVDEISVGNFVEATHVITPVPESTELVTRFSTSINTNNRFYTDDNGFEMLERIYDPTIQLAIPGNYYPTIYQSYITDGSNSFSVISERTHGVTSQQSGQLEVMLQRKTPMDDGRGVDEPLDEDDTITPVLRYVLDTARYSVLLRYKNSYELNFPPSIFYAPTTSVESWKNTHRVKYSALATTLPANVHLLSLKLLNSTSNNYIVRLHHLVGVEEDDKWSRPVHVSLSNLFADFTVNSVTETTLTANKVISQHDVSRDVIVTLNAKDIRTFIVQLVPK